MKPSEIGQVSAMIRMMHHARRAVVAPGDGGRGRQRDADRGDLGEAVLRDVDGDQAEGAERDAVHRAVEDVVVLALARLFPGRQRRQGGELAHVPARG